MKEITIPPRGESCYAGTDWLPVLDSRNFPHGTSGYSRAGSNDDGFSCQNFLYTDETGHVICDVQGKGQISRIWLLVNAPAEDTSQDLIRIWIDGEKVCELPYSSFIEGQTAPFLQPYSVFEPCGCVRVCNLPMAFSESAKIACTRAKGFWQVDWQLFGEGDVKPFDPVHTADGGVLNKVTENPNLSGGNETVYPLLLAVGEEKRISLSGGGVLNGIRIACDVLNREKLNRLWLKIHWDGHHNADVEAPFGAFFGMGNLGCDHKTQSLMFGLDDGGVLYNYFPMPFWQSARITVENQGVDEVAMELRLRLSGDLPDSGEAGYFRTEYRNFYVPREDPFEAVLLSVGGSGKVVAVQENMVGNEGDAWFEEGDHRFYIDGLKVPSLIGTGTEDFYNGAGYFINEKGVPKLGLNSNAFSGYTGYVRTEKGGRIWEATAMYRVMIHDALEFRDGITIAFEHGGGEFADQPNWNSLQNVGYESLVSYYHRPKTSICRVDTVKAEDLPRESVSSAYFGRGYLFPGEKSFGYLDRAITLEFRLGSGEGALLRRSFDCGRRSKAAVWVVGVLAGIWQCSEENEFYRFSEDQFYIPASLTADKQTICVTLEPLEGSWNFEKIDLYTFARADASADWNGRIYTIAEVGDFRLVTEHRGRYCLVNNSTGAILGDTDGLISRTKVTGDLDERYCWTVNADPQGFVIQNAASGLYLLVEAGELVLSEHMAVLPMTEVTKRRQMLLFE